MEKFLYHYKADVIKVYDGDTITVNIDLGLKTVIMKEKIRLARINTPELRGKEKEAGKAARDFLRNLILDKSVVIETIKDRKGRYGRYIGEVWVENKNGKLFNVNDYLVKKGFADYVKY